MKPTYEELEAKLLATENKLAETLNLLKLALERISTLEERLNKNSIIALSLLLLSLLLQIARKILPITTKALKSNGLESLENCFLRIKLIIFMDGLANGTDDLSGLCDRLYDEIDKIWMFSKFTDVDPTNNLAQRDVRRLVLWRKKVRGLAVIEENIL